VVVDVGLRGRRAGRRTGGPRGGVRGDGEWSVAVGTGEVHATGMTDGVCARGSTSVDDFTQGGSTAP
jgi:hypothetical protein